MASGLPILMYHRVLSQRCPAPDAEEARYGVDLDAFVRQLDGIASMGYVGVGVQAVLGDLARGEVPERRVVLTFDDGNRSDYEHATPLLEERGFGATFFVTGRRIGRGDGLEEEMIEDMCRRGMEIGAHGQTHRFLSLLDEADHRHEIEAPAVRLAGITGRPVRVFAPPGGRYNRTTLQVLRAMSFDAMCTSRFGYNGAGTDRFALRRMPVTRDTEMRTFTAMVEGAVSKLLPAYLRATALDLARRVLGERNYARLRSTMLGG